METASSIDCVENNGSISVKSQIYGSALVNFNSHDNHESATKSNEIDSKGKLLSDNVVDLNDICDGVNNLSISTPSVSGVKCATKLKKIAYLKSDGEISDEEEHSQYEATLQNYSDVSVTRGRSNILSFPQYNRCVVKIFPEYISSPDSPVDEKKIDTLYNSGTDLFDDSDNLISQNPYDENKLPERSLQEERSDLQHWRVCNIGGVYREIDMKVIDPYKRVLSHGGYLSTGSHNAIITFCPCFLPHKSRIDYNYVMDNLFFYVLHTLNQLVTDDYVLVYLHGGTSKDCMPTFSWVRRCYQMINRKLKKNLKSLYLVHPTFWLKTVVVMIKPFISSKFSRKMHFINTLAELYDALPIEGASIPDKVKQYDRRKSSLI